MQQDISREQLIEEIEKYKRQLTMTESEKRRNDLQKCIARLKRQPIQYDNLKRRGKGHVI